MFSRPICELDFVFAPTHPSANTPASRGASLLAGHVTLHAFRGRHESIIDQGGNMKKMISRYPQVQTMRVPISFAVLPKQVVSTSS